MNLPRQTECTFGVLIVFEGEKFLGQTVFVLGEIIVVEGTVVEI